MTESEQAQVEAALRTAYQRGWRDARYWPHRREPALTIDWGEHPHLTTQWDTEPEAPDPLTERARQS